MTKNRTRIEKKRTRIGGGVKLKSLHSIGNRAQMTLSRDINNKKVECIEVAFFSLSVIHLQNVTCHKQSFQMNNWKSFESETSIYNNHIT